MFRDRGRGKGERVCFTTDVTTPRRHFFINFLVNESFFLEVSNTHIVFCCLKTRQSVRDTRLGTLMWIDFVAKTVS